MKYVLLILVFLLGSCQCSGDADVSIRNAEVDTGVSDVLVDSTFHKNATQLGMGSCRMSKKPMRLRIVDVSDKVYEEDFYVIRQFCDNYHLMGFISADGKLYVHARNILNIEFK